jgi:uncharacterized protein YegJ (DUF2314 family)
MSKPPGDVPLNILDESRNPWSLPEPRTTVLFGLLLGDEPPTEYEVTAAIEAVYGAVVDSSPVDGDEADALWSVWLETEAHECPLLIASLPARPLPEAEAISPEARACRWAVRVETVLDRNACIEDFTKLVRAIATIREGTPAVFDAESHRWHLRESLEERFIPEEALPPADILWIIHAVRESESPEACQVWLHTHGLWRCGVPELEMIEVPRELATAAASLINDLGEQLLEFEPPAPAQPFSIGQHLELSIHPWQSAAAQLPEQAVGSVAMRRRIDHAADVDEHQGVRAVICGPAPRGRLKSVWTYPDEAVRRYAEKTAVVYRSAEASRRDERLARHGWPTFATAFACAQRYARDVGVNIAEFLAKARFETAAAAEEACAREHLWFEIVRVDGDRAEGRLLNNPTLVPALRQGDLAWIAREQVSDWQIRTPRGNFGPGSAASVLKTIDALRVETS